MIRDIPYIPKLNCSQIMELSTKVSISDLLSDSLTLIGCAKTKTPPSSPSSSIGYSNSKDHISEPVKSASSILLESRRQQQKQIKESQDSLFVPFSAPSNLAPLYQQISSSEVNSNPKLEHLMKNDKKAHRAAAKPIISKSKLRHRLKGEEYRDKTLERIANKSNRNLRKEKLKGAY